MCQGASPGPGSPAHDGLSMLPEPTPVIRAASDAAQLVHQVPSRRALSASPSSRVCIGSRQSEVSMALSAYLSSPVRSQVPSKPRREASSP